MKEFLDWLLQIGDSMLIIAALAVSIGKKWLEGEEKERRAQRVKKVPSSKGSTSRSSKRTRLRENVDQNDIEFLNRVADNCANVTFKLLEKAEKSKHITLNNEDIVDAFYHKSLIEECLERDLVAPAHVIKFTLYIDKLENILLIKQMSYTTCVSLLDQLREIGYIIKSYIELYLG